MRFKLLSVKLCVAMSLICASGQLAVPDRAWCNPFCSLELAEIFRLEEVCAAPVPDKTKVSPDPVKQKKPEAPQINNNSQKATSVIQVIKQGEENVVKLEWLLYISIFLLAVNLYRSQQLEYKISGNKLSWLVKPLFRKEEKNINDSRELDQISEIIKAVNKDINQNIQELSQVVLGIDQANAKAVQDENKFKQLASDVISKLNEEVNKLEKKFNESNQVQNRDLVELQNKIDQLDQKQGVDFSSLKDSLDQLKQSLTSQNNQIEEVNKLEKKFNESNQVQNRDLVELQNKIDQLDQKQGVDFSSLKDSLDQLKQSHTIQNNQIKDTINNLTLLANQLYEDSQTYQGIINQLRQFADRFTPVLVHIESKVQQEQKRTQTQTWENSGGTPSVVSKTETNAAVYAAKKVRHSDMPRDIVQMVEIFNNNASDFTYRYQNCSVAVAEERKSSIERFQGDEQQIYFEAHNAGSFFAVMDNPRNIDCEIYWLVPKPNTKPNEFKGELWKKLFGYEGQNCTRYKLVAPAKISNLENGKRFILDCAGEIDFS